MNITNGYRQVPFEAIGATLPFSADVNISGRSWFPAILIGFSLLPRRDVGGEPLDDGAGTEHGVHAGHGPHHFGGADRGEQAG